MISWSSLKQRAKSVLILLRTDFLPLDSIRSSLFPIWTKLIDESANEKLWSLSVLQINIIKNNILPLKKFPILCNLNMYYLIIIKQTAEEYEKTKVIIVTYKKFVFSKGSFHFLNFPKIIREGESHSDLVDQRSILRSQFLESIRLHYSWLARRLCLIHIKITTLRLWTPLNHRYMNKIKSKTPAAKSRKVIKLHTYQ